MLLGVVSTAMHGHPSYSHKTYTPSPNALSRQSECIEIYKFERQILIFFLGAKPLTPCTVGVLLNLSFISQHAYTKSSKYTPAPHWRTSPEAPKFCSPPGSPLSVCIASLTSYSNFICECDRLDQVYSRQLYRHVLHTAS